MGKKADSIQNILGTLVAAAGMAVSVGATAKVGGPTGKVASPPRGAEIGGAAANCPIGPFPMTSKAGEYSRLCGSMQDAEKCLAVIKLHFNTDGTTEKTTDPDKMTYCLNELGKALGAN